MNNTQPSYDEVWDPSNNDPSWNDTLLLTMANETGNITAYTDDEDLADDDVWVLPKKSSIVPIFTGGLSILGSYIILREVIFDHRDGRGKTIPRLLMGLSVSDMFFSFANVLSTFVSPKELDYIWGNVGNTASCTFQGFIAVLGYTASPLFNLALSFCYLLIVKYNKKERDFQKYELLVHGLIWTVALAIAIVPIPLEMYNNNYESCWVAAYPVDCEVYDDVPCERGTESPTLNLFVGFFAWPSVFISAIIMGILWWTVRDMENQISKYAGNRISQSLKSRSNSTQSSEAIRGLSFDTEEPAEINIDRRRSKSVAIQGACYILAFLATYILHFIAKILWISAEISDEGLWFAALVVFMPLQGFWNCLVFVRQREMRTCEGRCFRKAFCFWRKDPASVARRQKGGIRNSTKNSGGSSNL